MPIFKYLEEGLCHKKQFNKSNVSIVYNYIKTEFKQNMSYFSRMIILYYISTMFEFRCCNSTIPQCF